MELTPQDTLRLNVLLANKPQAVRINENSMTVFGLSASGEAQVKLNPTGRPDQYLKRVRELLSGHVLGSPGGYPVYLQRWTRMGQMRDDSLAQLLLLGEPEAVIAAVSAQGLTDELARRAWWAMEDPTNARHMLRKQAIVEGQMGPLLAAYLVEHLPFENEPEQQIETIRLVLQPGLLEDEAIEALWRKAQRKPAYYVGFILARPDRLPVETRAHPLAASDTLTQLARQGNSVARLLQRVCSANGQAFLATVVRIFEKPSNQEVVILTLEAIAGYFEEIRPDGRVDMTLDGLDRDAAAWLRRDADARAVAGIAEVDPLQLIALRLLSGLSYGVVRPAFGDSTAIGTLMRRKLQPVLEPLLEILARLQVEDRPVGGAGPAQGRRSGRRRGR
jgi:hypothetical protein